MSLLLLFHGAQEPPPRRHGGEREHAFDPRILPRPKSAKSVQEERERLGILPRAAEAISDVAQQQAELLRLDELQREQQLREEMRLRGIQYEARYLALLNAERERLITLEIGRLMRARLQADQDTLTLLLIASTC